MAVLASACGAQGPLGPASNRAPQVRSVTLTPPVVPLGGSAALRVDAVDPDGDPLHFHYRAEAGTVTADPNDGSRAVYRNDGVGRAGDRITITVLDPSTAATITGTAVPLQGNRAPNVQISGGGSCHPSCSLGLEAVASDPDGDALTYTWSGCASGSSATSRCFLSTVGTITATVAVQDSRGGVATASRSLEGTNAAPAVTGGRRIQGIQSPFIVNEFDPDGDPTTCGWFGNCQCTGHITSYSLMCALPVELSRCTMRFACTDPFGATGQTTFELFR